MEHLINLKPPSWSGRTPFPRYSFLELRKVMGPVWIVCESCRRYVQLWRGLDGRDTRITTFSCSLCGGPGKAVLEDPAKEGLQADPRRRPLRHPLAVTRLRGMQDMAGRFGLREPPRESRVASHKPYREPLPKFRLVPLPIRTFREALDFGLELLIHCPGCHDSRPLVLTVQQLERPFTGSRFICRRVKRKLYGEGTDVCGRAGEIVFRPIERVADHETVDIQCVGAGRRRHSPWEIEGVDLETAPWGDLLDAGKQRFSCPGCGGKARHTFHSAYRSGSEPVAGHLLKPGGAEVMS